MRRLNEQPHEQPSDVFKRLTDQRSARRSGTLNEVLDSKSESAIKQALEHLRSKYRSLTYREQAHHSGRYFILNYPVFRDKWPYDPEATSERRQLSGLQMAVLMTDDLPDTMRVMIDTSLGWSDHPILKDMRATAQQLAKQLKLKLILSKEAAG